MKSEFEKLLRRRYWRQMKLGGKHYTWDQAVEHYTTENSHLRGWEPHQACQGLGLNLTARAAVTNRSHQELTEAVVTVS